MQRLGDALQAEGFGGTVFVMHSGGGLQPAPSMARLPVRTVTSGPAAGVIAAAAIGEAAGRRNLLTIDIGGTSADIATVRDGQLGLARQSMPEFGLPDPLPGHRPRDDGRRRRLDRLDRPRRLAQGRAAERRRGAGPGGLRARRDGRRRSPTRTSCSGASRRSAAWRATCTLDVGLARDAVGRFGDRLGLDVEEAAAGIIRIANANMTRWLRVVTVERGLDPREFALFAFGGAGPMHAVDLALGLEIPEVLVPRHPGVTSALGLLFADVTHDVSTTLVRAAGDLDGDEIERRFAELEGQAGAALDADGFARATAPCSAWPTSATPAR